MALAGDADAHALALDLHFAQVVGGGDLRQAGDDGEIETAGFGRDGGFARRLLH